MLLDDDPNNDPLGWYNIGFGIIHLTLGTKDALSSAVDFSINYGDGLSRSGTNYYYDIGTALITPLPPNTPSPYAQSDAIVPYPNRAVTTPIVFVDGNVDVDSIVA